MKINEWSSIIKTFFGSSIKAEQSLLVFVNGLLQKPNYAYNLGSGGSSIVFTTHQKQMMNVVFYSIKEHLILMLLFSVLQKQLREVIIDINNNPEKGQGQV